MKASSRYPHSIPVIDLFAGPGGLSEGFSSLTVGDGTHPFRIRLSIESNPIAHATLRLRSFYRQFEGNAPDDYYRFLRGELRDIDQLYGAYPQQAERAAEEAWNKELGKLHHRELNRGIRNALSGAEESVMIGGPPCQAYSMAGRSRNRGVGGYRAESDKRQYLYVEYLQAIADHWPAVFVMENVKGLLSASLNNQRLFHRIVSDLESPHEALKREKRHIDRGRTHRYRLLSLATPVSSEASRLDDYLVMAERHGIPQARHRVILIGVRDDLGSNAIEALPLMDEVPCHQVIEDLPRLRSGLSRGNDSSDAWLSAITAALNGRWLAGVHRAAGGDVEEEIVRSVSKVVIPRLGRGTHFVPGDFRPSYRPDWFVDARLGGVIQHESREHMADDLRRYLFVSAFGRVNRRSPKLREFPAHLLPQHANVDAAIHKGQFGDRFRVQLKHKSATTITSHIAKDGHYYIHYDPTQCRSLTLREAARLQTFPDNYFFCGTRTEAYGQVGNAVPPLLANSIAKSVWAILKKSGCLR